MPEDSSSQDKLRVLLKTLFQFDCADLDFGIYRIMNYKRKEIENFIDKDLIQAVEREFEAFKALSARELLDKLDEKKKKIQDLEKELGKKILKNGGIIEDKYKDGKTAREYLAIKAQLDDVRVTENLQTQVFNDLYSFFSRYYEDGDFISKPRRSSKGARYSIPYDGEEVRLYWANFDQYYVKTAEVFKNYEFTSKGWRISFETTLADAEAGNNKGQRRYFLLAPSSPVNCDKDNKTCLIQFEYRPLTDQDHLEYKVKTKSGEEKKTAIQQDELNAILKDKILEQIKDSELKAVFSEQLDEKTTLEKNLYKYTRKITSDFFIHKNLKGFLERELDYFIKSEVLDINNLEPRHITKARVVEKIARRIIEFLAQIEDFQKLLWEKKKFVLRTDYVVTTDLIPTEFYAEILANKNQLKEWEELNFGEMKKRQDVEGKKLPVDTKHFGAGFKERLLENLSEQGNLDDLVDGILIKSENWQALNLLLEKYQDKVTCIYNDPPYNSPSTEIIYKNNYKHSSWITLMFDRLHIANRLLKGYGTIAIAIDDHEYTNLRAILLKLFSGELQTVVVRSNPAGRSTPQGFSLQHEYAVFTKNNDSDSNVLGRLQHSEKQIQRYKERDAIGAFEWVNFRKHGGVREESPKMYYPIFIDKSTLTWRIPEMNWNEATNEWVMLEQPTENEYVSWPIDEMGQQRRWKWAIERLRSDSEEVKLDCDKNGVLSLYIKSRIRPEGRTPPTWWDKKEYSATDSGTKTLKDLFGRFGTFDYPKAVVLVEDCLKVAALDETGLVIDHFAGSGTTAHAVIDMNRQDKGKRKYILVEIGDWFETVILPRIKKVVFCENWKDGKPAGGEGVSHFLKYLYLEQYEDTLHNIEFLEQEKGQAALNLFEDEYLMKYMLQYETEGSPSLLNLGQLDNPFEYKLKIISQGKGEQLVTIDLVETFNYLLGLTVCKYKFLTDNGRKYVFVLGEKRNRRIAVVWRPTKDIDLQKDKEVIDKTLADFHPDEIFVNGDALMNHKVTETEFKKLMGV